MFGGGQSDAQLAAELRALLGKAEKIRKRLERRGWSVSLPLDGDDLSFDLVPVTIRQTHRREI